MTYTTGDTLLNKYRIERLLGRGGFAEVYLATHLQLSTPRALKVLRRDALGLGSSEYHLFEERFRVEAELGELFDHPNLVRVHDFDLDAGTLILVMEFCPGGSLANCLYPARGKVELFTIGQAIQLGKDVARGLAELHHRDIVHRDLKPSNILFDVSGQAKVADFGLAQTPGGFSQRSLLGSLSPKHPGTPGYMSPEQEKTTDYLRPASDVYALGVVLFEALTGRNYHNLAPGTHLSSLRPDAPGWLDELLMQMLHKDPEQRPWDGNVLLGLVEQAVLEEARQQQTALEHQAAEEKTRHAAEEKARLDAEEQQRILAEAQRQVELAAQERLVQEEKARREIAEKTRREAEEKARLEAEAQRRKEVKERATKEAEAQRQKEKQEQHKQEDHQSQVAYQNQRIAPPGSREDSQSLANKSQGNKRSPVVWVGMALAGLVILGLAALALAIPITPRAASPVQTGTAVLATHTTENLPAAIASTVAPTHKLLATATHTSRPKPTTTNTILPTASPTPTLNSINPPSQAALGDTWTSPVDGMELVYIPAGDFEMGCFPFLHNDGFKCDFTELPSHTVTLDAYWMDKTEVTNAQYEKCVDEGACVAPSNNSSYSRSLYYNNPEYANYPVIRVSWYNASDYCDWAGRVLPTEAQWEKAARGTRPRAYPWGNTSPTCDLVNGEVDGSMCVGETTEVGSYPSGASPYDVMDMAGNVWEWVRDWYFETYYSSLDIFINPVGPNTGTHRVIRGGSFSYDVYFLRTAYRNLGNPDYRINYVGFRCAAPAPFIVGLLTPEPPTLP